MKKCYLLAALLLSFPCFAINLTADALEGAWVITSMAGMADDEGDMWEFENGKFYQNLGGRRISPDNYTIDGHIIDLDGYHIKVIEFDGQKMKADMAGYVYELNKK